MASLIEDHGLGRIHINTWALTNADGEGNHLTLPGSPDRTVQCVGPFGGATVKLYGSNQRIPTDWAVLHDPSGADISFTAPGIVLVLENPVHVKPSLTGGAGSTVSVILASRSPV
jgi:hypothetical protein